MKNKKSDWIFLLKNCWNPEGKVTISLGKTEEGIRYRNYFNQRHWKRLFLKNKKFNCSIVDLQQSGSFEEYIKTVKGKNSADYFYRRAKKMGYVVERINPNEYIEDIYRINTSSESRQGRKMDAGYLTKVEHWPNNETNTWIGAFDENRKLVSYIWLIDLHEMVLINRILGDSDHLKNNIMYLTILGAIEYTFSERKYKYIMYDTFGRKQNGLVLFKKRIGFKPYTVSFKE